MNHKPFCVFVSAVTSEFKSARDLVASKLRARGLKVRVQEDFRQEADADTTLRKLHNYVSDCDAVVAIMGQRSGGFPPDSAAADFPGVLPPGFDRASRTQWEVHFARHYGFSRAPGKRLSFYVANPDYDPEEKTPREPGDPKLQARLIRYLFEELELDREYFSNKHELAMLVLQESWPDHSGPKPKSDRFVSIGELFKGREDEMARLRENLAQGGRAAVTAKAQAIHGLGGVGKTRLALEYGIAHEKDYTALLFLSGETPAALEASIQGLAGVLGIPGYEELKEDQRRQEVLDWLRHNPGWLLVIDNLDTPEALKAAEGILANMSHGHAVVTTRLANFSAHFTPLEVDVLSLDAAVAFLMERTKGRRRETAGDAGDARAIAVDLGQLALALEQAGAYVSRRRQGFSDYRREWARESAKLLGWHDDSVTGYPRSVAVTWRTSVAQMSEGARALMEHLAFLAPEPAPEALLDVAVPGLDADPRDAFDEIAAFSLVSRHAEQPTFAMHRLVQDVTRRDIDESRRELRVTAALYWIYAAIREERGLPAPERRALLLALSLHVDALTDYAVSAEAIAAARYLLVEIGDAFLVAGLSTTARRARTRALGVAKTRAEGDPGNAGFQLDLSISYERLGDLAVAAGDAKAARDYFEKGLTVAKSLAEGDPGNSNFQRELSVLYIKMGDLAVAAGDGKAARDYFEKGLTVARSLAEGDPGNAGFQLDLSISYNKMG
ncbi:MAG: DUF4062 domain-containing protein, partial [Methylocystis sp.]